MNALRWILPVLALSILVAAGCGDDTADQQAQLTGVTELLATTAQCTGGAAEAADGTNIANDLQLTADELTGKVIFANGFIQDATEAPERVVINISEHAPVIEIRGDANTPDQGTGVTLCGTITDVAEVGSAGRTTRAIIVDVASLEVTTVPEPEPQETIEEPAAEPITGDQ